MKKIVTISLLLVYVWLFMGVTLWIHVCGESTTTSLIPFSKDPCGCDNSSDNDMCCKTELHQFQLNDTQHATPIAIIEKISTVLICDIPLSSSLSMDYTPSIPVAINPSPPLSPPIHILNCSFLI